ncbi:hypothetical protein TeGR_g10353 [Tetraparma gracilis]|uniref:Uncharacterized protein n=1 Tax=Tetraparma gracilis TaxID=2962635 RepID=A0ABQ6M5E1_9STRA|nr:hypothetical protein TeGR_g10353 [Tetraparma gracilis]
MVNFFMGSIDTVSVGRFGGLVQLGALAPATAAVDYISYVFSFLSTASLTLMASSTASEERSRVFAVAIKLCLIAGLTQGALSFVFAAPLSSALGAVGELAVPSASYLSWRALGLPFFQLLAVGSAACFAAGDSLTPFLVGLAQGAINFGGNSVLCARMASPIAGAGIATVLSQLVTCMGLYGIMKKRGMLPSWGDLRGLPTKKQSTPYFRFYKLTVLAAARLAVYAVVTRLCCRVSPASAAAAQVGSQLWWGSTCFSSESMCASVQSYLPSRVGEEVEGEGGVRSLTTAEARATVKRHLVFGSAWALVSAGALWKAFGGAGGQAPGWLLGLVSGDPKVLKLLPTLPILAASFLCAPMLVLESTLIVLRRLDWLVKTAVITAGASVGYLYWMAKRLGGANTPTSMYGGVVLFISMRLVTHIVGVWRALRRAAAEAEAQAALAEEESRAAEEQSRAAEEQSRAAEEQSRAAEEESRARALAEEESRARALAAMRARDRRPDGSPMEPGEAALSAIRNLRSRAKTSS